MKVTGAEFVKFYNDPTVWTDGVYYEDVVFSINGVEADELPEILLDTDIVSFSGGFITDEDGNDMGTFTGVFRKWKKKQTIAVFVVECDISKADYIRQCVRTAGGRVK
jgi:hypothetical protein